jgi:mono/diheme cytochrome c family protein
MKTLLTLCSILVMGVAGLRPVVAADPELGQAKFVEVCAMCHRAGGMGTGILARRAGDTSKGLLESRADLSAVFVRAVVRTGIGNMPRISRGEVSDPTLNEIASYLAKGRP